MNSKREIMQVPIDDIKVKRRIRKDLGDIEILAESLKLFGQINPVVITSRNVLISGQRRLEAARALGWRTINAVIVEFPDALSKLEYEVEENIQRRDFTPEEVAEATRRIYRLKNPGFFRRILNAIIRFFKWLFRIRD
jgi:ParB family chromosome partitioning protein